MLILETFIDYLNQSLSFPKKKTEVQKSKLPKITQPINHKKSPMMGSLDSLVNAHPTPLRYIQVQLNIISLSIYPLLQTEIQVKLFFWIIKVRLCKFKWLTKTDLISNILKTWRLYHWTTLVNLKHFILNKIKFEYNSPNILNILRRARGINGDRRRFGLGQWTVHRRRVVELYARNPYHLVNQRHSTKPNKKGENHF